MLIWTVHIYILRDAFLNLQEKIWPQVGTETWHKSDVYVGVLFSFTSSMPSNLLPQIMTEWIQMGAVVSLWQTGCIARCGAVEVILWQDVHGGKYSYHCTVENLNTVMIILLIIKY